MPLWAVATLVLLVAVGVSAFARTRYIGNQFWMDEGLSVGISTHRAARHPTVLRHDGSPPLYYMLLHIWMTIAGNSETATHWMSLIFGLLSIPAGAWAAWSLFGRWPALVATILFALNPFLTAYSEETRMYSLMALLGLLATTAFVHAFVYRRRGYLVMFTVCQALMLYTHAWGIFYGIGAALAFALLWRVSDEPRELLRDGADRVRSRRGAVSPVAAHADLPGHAHRFAVGQRTRLRRARADLAQPDGRRPGDDAARARRRARPLGPVRPPAAHEPRGADHVGRSS